MARRKLSPSDPANPGRVIPAVALIVGPARLGLRDRLGDRVRECLVADTPAEAVRVLERHDVGLVLITGDDVNAWSDLASRAQADDAAIVMVADHPSLDAAVHAMRWGACDLLASDAPSAEIVARLQTAVRRAGSARARAERVDRLRKVCRKINDARAEVTQQVGSLCDDLTSAYQELSEQFVRASIGSEYAAIIRQELDLESLLRSSLEYLLAKVGPTNAAVFLPASSGDFSLGAYINYDCGPDAGDTLLEELAHAVVPRLEHRRDVLRLNDAQAVDRWIGDAAPWLTGSCVMGFACHDGDECLALAIVFRDKNTPFPEHLGMLVGVIADHLGRQLARVVRIHHRHLPDPNPGLLDLDDDPGLAA